MPVNRPPLKAQHWLLFGLVAALFFAWGAWLMRSGEVTPVADLPRWRDALLQPLAQERLALREVQALASGELWLQPRLDGARVLHRAELAGAEGGWALEAEERIQVPFVGWPVPAARDPSTPAEVLIRISAQRYNEPADYARLAAALVRRLG